jgi:hypothetical protein
MEFVKYSVLYLLAFAAFVLWVLGSLWVGALMAQLSGGFVGLLFGGSMFVGGLALAGRWADRRGL